MEAIVRNKETLPFLSFIIGMGLAVIIASKPKLVKPMLNIPVSQLEGRTIAYDGKCYKYHAEDAKCEILRS